LLCDLINQKHLLSDTVTLLVMPTRQNNLGLVRYVIVSVVQDPCEWFVFGQPSDFCFLVACKKVIFFGVRVSILHSHHLQLL
jgi:hypothetical protein